MNSLRKMISKWLFTAVFLLSASFICATDNRPYPDRHKEVLNQSKELVLADNGKALADIILPEKCSPVVDFAAEELKKYLDKATGADFKIIRSKSFKSRPKPVRTRTAIMLGESPWTKAMTGVNFAALPRDSFVIKEVNDAIIIAGRDDPFTDPEKELKDRNGFWHHYDHATLFGVYDFLERFVGVRFYFPIEELIYIPKIQKLQVPSMDIEESPDFTARCVYWNPYSEYSKENKSDWTKNNKMLQIRNLQTLYGRNETLQIPNCHGLQGLGLITRFGESHPEYFALMENGKRANILRRKQPGDHGAHLCYHNKELEDVIFEDAKSFLSAESATVRNIQSRYDGIEWNRSVYYAYPGYFNIHPSDGMVKCLCPKCKPYADNISDLFFPFMARIAKRLKDAGIKGTITTMPYTYYKDVPTNCEFPDNVEIMLATLGPWDEHKLSREELAKPDKLLADWSKKNHGKKSFVWNYMISDRGMTQKGVPPMSPRSVSSYYKRNADVLAGPFTQCGIWDILHNYLNMYVLYKTSWNTSTDVEALLAEHHKNLFGPAAKPMGKFYDLLEELWLSKGLPTIQKTPLGPVAVKKSQYQIWEESYTPQQLDKLTACLNRAEALAKQSPSHLKRVEFIKKYFLDSIKKERAKYMALKREIEDVVLDVPMLKDSVKIDGKLDEEIWKKAATVYMNPIIKEAPSLQTEVKVFYDNGSLYIGFDCQEPEMANMKLEATKRDGEVWADSCVEVFLKLSNKREEIDYYHFMVNAAGVVADEKRYNKKKGDFNWNTNAETAARRDDKSFMIELRIPIKEILGRPVAPGDEFLANFARARFLQGKTPKNGLASYYTWTPYIRFKNGMGGFHDVNRYGLLRFVEEGKKKRP